MNLYQKRLSFGNFRLGYMRCKIYLQVDVRYRSRYIGNESTFIKKLSLLGLSGHELAFLGFWKYFRSIFMHSEKKVFFDTSGLSIG